MLLCEVVSRDKVFSGVWRAQEGRGQTDKAFRRYE